MRVGEQDSLGHHIASASLEELQHLFRTSTERQAAHAHDARVPRVWIPWERASRLCSGLGVHLAALMRVDHVLLGGREELDVPPSHVRTVLRLKRVRGILLISKSYVPVARGASLAVEAEQRSSQGNLKVAEKLGNRLLCRLCVCVCVYVC